jgi:hypothetical protein
MTMHDLSAIPDTLDRLQADDDFRRAVEARHAAHLQLRWRLPAWRFVHRLEMRRAIRAWKHYAKAVRKASHRRAA